MKKTARAKKSASKLSKVECPNCHARFVPPLKKQVEFIPPPIDLDDFDWFDGEETFTCPQCAATLSVMVRRNLDGTNPIVGGKITVVRLTKS